jgi:hypothetical protein
VSPSTAPAPSTSSARVIAQARPPPPQVRTDGARAGAHADQVNAEVTRPVAVDAGNVYVLRPWRRDRPRLPRAGMTPPATVAAALNGPAAVTTSPRPRGHRRRHRLRGRVWRAASRRTRTPSIKYDTGLRSGAACKHFRCVRRRIRRHRPRQRRRVASAKRTGVPHERRPAGGSRRPGDLCALYNGPDGLGDNGTHVARGRRAPCDGQPWSDHDLRRPDAKYSGACWARRYVGAGGPEQQIESAQTVNGGCTWPVSGGCLHRRDVTWHRP